MHFDWLILNNIASELKKTKHRSFVLNSVVFSNSLSDFWDPGTDKLTYGILNKLLKFAEANKFSIY